jgi:hypothetical protein
LNALPCNYYSKVKLTFDTSNPDDSCFIPVPCQVGFKFDDGAFNNMQTTANGIKSGFIADKLYALAQLTEGDDLPEPNMWKSIDITSQIPGYVSGLINPTGLTDTTFTITKTMYDAASIFDLETHMTSVLSNYMGDTTFTTQPQFGDEQYFPGSVKVVRASDVEEMRFMINLSSTEFLVSQNPTYTNGSTNKITEVALLDGNKDIMVIGKASIPITRTGTQVIPMKLDF